MTLSVKKISEKLILPISQNEDKARREFILNILLLSIIGLAFITFVIKLIDWLINDFQGAMSAGSVFIILSFFVFLYFLSRKGFLRLASYGLLTAFLLPVSYTVYAWGLDLPAALLTYALIIVMAGVLVDTRFAFLTTAVIVAVMSLIGYAEHIGLLKIDRYWRGESWILVDLIIIFIMFFVIATVSWLSNREIEKSLARTRKSEAELKKERDSLEITVEARTKELKETQAEKMTQLYRFAEFGRLSSGLFHDLINPLTAVSLNIEKIKNADQDTHTHVKSIQEKTGAAPISEVSEYVDKAIVAAKKMEDMVSAVRKQLSRQETKVTFSINEEIAQAIEVLSYKALKANVNIRFFPNSEIKTYGDAVKFNQVALNLIVNAIDAYVPAIALAKAGQKKANADSKSITMSLSKEGGMIVFEVKDKGVGISEENKPKLFEPFFTTKEEGYGLGIGLSMIKRIIEKDFGGDIILESKEGEGSVFTVKFPQKN